MEKQDKAEKQPLKPLDDKGRRLWQKLKKIGATDHFPTDNFILP